MAEHQSDRIIDRHERRQLVPYSDNHILRLDRGAVSQASEAREPLNIPSIMAN